MSFSGHATCLIVWMINQDIFKEYDIRGIAETDLSSEAVHKIGMAIGTHFINNGAKLVTLGYDCRLSSPRISHEIQECFLSCGLDVWNVGMVHTPLSYFSVNAFEQVNGGVMITASHNPPEYNGIKISLGKSTIYGDEIQKIKNILLQGGYASGHGKLTHVDLKEEYIQKILASIHHPLNLKVVIDSGNGMAGPIAPELFRRLGCEVIDLFSDPDGRFPNHQPDPTVLKNMKTLISEVKKQGVLAGVGFDGDADRIGVVDRTGRMIYGDELLVIYSRELLKTHPGAKIISEVKSSDRLFRDIKKHGGEPILWKTGHSLIKAKMKEENAPLAGEMSGHMFFADRYFGFDDALYAAARLFEILSKEKKTPLELIGDLPASFTTPEIRMDCEESKKFEIVDRAKTLFKEMGLSVNTIDGARIEFPDGWGLVRASNTQSVLVFRFEAQSEKRLQEIRVIIESAVKKATLSLANQEPTKG